MPTNLKPARKFYCYPSEQVEGPFQLVELAGLLRAGHITGETLTLLEGEEQWLPFQDRQEFHFDKEIPQDAIDRHLKESHAEQESSFTPRKLLSFAWVMAIPLLIILYRVVMAYLRYETGHDTSAADDALNSAGGS